MHTWKLVICVGVLVGIGMLIYVPSLPGALAELRRAVVTTEECEELSGINDLVRAQKGKSPEVKSKTANILRRHEFDEESKFLAGRRSRPSFVCLYYVVQWIDSPYDSHLMTCTARSYLFSEAHLASAVCSVSCQRLTATCCVLEYPLTVALYAD